MLSCKKCGYEFRSNQKFCENCGTPLDKAHPDLQNKNTKYSVNSIFRATTTNFDNFNIYITEIINVSTSMIRKPVSTITTIPRTLKRESTFILLGILSLLYALFKVWGIKTITSNIISSTSGYEFSQQARFSDIIKGLILKISIDISFTKIFFVALLLFIICVVVIFAANFSIGKYLFYAPIDAINILKVTTCSFIPLIAGLFIQIIFSYISITMGFIFLFIFLIISLLCLFKGITFELKLSEDKIAFIIPASLVIMFLVDYIFLYSVLKN